MRTPPSPHLFIHLNNKWSFLSEPLLWVKGWCMGAQREHVGCISGVQVCTNRKVSDGGECWHPLTPHRERKQGTGIAAIVKYRQSVHTETEECLQERNTGKHTYHKIISCYTLSDDWNVYVITHRPFLVLNSCYIVPALHSASQLMQLGCFPSEC